VQLDDAAQRGFQLLGPREAERFEHALFVLTRQRDQPGDRAAAGGRDADQRDAAVAVVAEALDLAAHLHPVEKPRHRRLLEHRDLRELVQAEYDEGGAIGKRYRRQDEIGTPFCLTIDHQSLQDRTVTLRDRDSLSQERLPIDGIADEIERRVKASWGSPKLPDDNAG